MVQASDLLENKQILMEADMVVLAAAIEPNKDVRKMQLDLPQVLIPTTSSQKHMQSFVR